MTDVALSADIDLGEALVWRSWTSSVPFCASGLRHWSATGGADITSAVGRAELFASLFRWREDVFTTRWESTRTPGRSGWAPSWAVLQAEGEVRRVRAPAVRAVLDG